MQLEDLMNPEEEKLPEILIAKCKELKETDNSVETIEEIITDLAKVTEELDDILRDIEEKLRGEQEAEKELKMAGKDTTDVEELEKLKKEFSQCSDAHEKARNTNSELCAHFEQTKPLIQLLIGPQESILASLPSQNVIDAPIDEPVVQRLRELLNKVTQMKAQRKQLESKLRDKINKDDITRELVVREDGNREAFFQEQLRKHDELCGLIRQNLSAQENILKALTEANAKYAPTRLAAMEIAFKREETIQSYIAKIVIFKEVGLRLRKGMQFYQTLKETLTKFQKKVDEFCSRKDKERGKLGKAKKEAPPARPTAPKPQLNSAPSNKIPLVPGNLPPGSYLPGHIPPRMPKVPGMVHLSSIGPRMQPPRLPAEMSQGIHPNMPRPDGLHQDMHPNVPGAHINQPSLSIPGSSSGPRTVPQAIGTQPVFPTSQDPVRPQSMPHSTGDGRPMPSVSSSELSLLRRDLSAPSSLHSSSTPQSSVQPDAFQRPMQPNSQALQPRIPGSVNLPSGLRMPVSQDASQINRTRPDIGQLGQRYPSPRMQHFSGDQFRPPVPGGQMMQAPVPPSGSLSRPQGMRPNVRTQTVDPSQYLQRPQMQQPPGQLPPSRQQIAPGGSLANQFRPAQEQQSFPTGQLPSIRGQPPLRQIVPPQGQQQHPQDLARPQFPMQMPPQHGLQDRSRPVQPQLGQQVPPIRPQQPMFEQLNRPTSGNLGDVNQRPNLMGQQIQGIRRQPPCSQQELQPQGPSAQQQWRPQHPQGLHYFQDQSPIRPVARPALPEPLIPQRVGIHTDDLSKNTPSSLPSTSFQTVSSHANPSLIPEQQKNPTSMSFPTGQQQSGFGRQLNQPGIYSQSNTSGTVADSPGFPQGQHGTQQVPPINISNAQMLNQHLSQANMLNQTQGLAGTQQVLPNSYSSPHSLNQQPPPANIAAQTQTKLFRQESAGHPQMRQPTMLQPQQQQPSSVPSQPNIRPQIVSNTQDTQQKQFYGEGKSMYPQQGLSDTLTKQTPHQSFPQSVEMGSLKQTPTNQLSEASVTSFVPPDKIAQQAFQNPATNLIRGSLLDSKQSDVSKEASLGQGRSGSEIRSVQSEAPSQMQYAFQGPMSSPVMSDPRTKITHPPMNDQPFSGSDQTNFTTFSGYNTAGLRLVQNRPQLGMTAQGNFPAFDGPSPDFRVYPPNLQENPSRNLPPQSPTQIVSPVTLNRKPLMAAAATDPLISAILGNQTRPQVQTPNQSNFGSSTDATQIGLQQLQLQQVLLQQQQLIGMLQSQQSQQRASESQQIDALQKQIIDQQKLIEKLSSEQHKLVEEQHKILEEQHKFVEEQQKQQVQSTVEQPRQEQHPVVVSERSQTVSSKTKTDLANYPSTNHSGIPALHTVDSSSELRETSKLPLPKTGGKCDDGKHCSSDQKDQHEERKSPSLSSQLMANIDSFDMEIEGILSNASQNLKKVDISQQKENTSQETSSFANTKIEPYCPSAIQDSSTSGKNLNKPSQSTNQYFPSADSETKRNSSYCLSESTGSVSKASVSSESEALSPRIVHQESNLPFYEPMLDTEQDKRGVQSTLASSSPSVSHEEEGGISTEQSSFQSSVIVSNAEQKLHNTSTVPLAVEQSSPDVDTRLLQGILPDERDSEWIERVAPVEDKVNCISVTETKSCPDNFDLNTQDTSESTIEKEKLNNLEILHKEVNSSDSSKPSSLLPSLKSHDLPDYPSLPVSDSRTDPDTAEKSTLEVTSTLVPSNQEPSDQTVIDTSRKTDSIAAREQKEDTDSVADNNVVVSNANKVVRNDGRPGLSVPSVVEPANHEDFEHPTLHRQQGRLSFYVPAESRAEEWKNYLIQLDASVDKFHHQCLDLCKRVPGRPMDGFTCLWNDLAKIEELDCHDFTIEAGKTNVTKNRYRDILPWDHTRVKLTTSENDYINASHIDLHSLTPLSPRYIASQGPIPQCFADFWTMVWEQGSTVIVMLTNEVEGNKLKCHPYWPRKLDQTTCYGKMAVTFTEQEAGPSWRGRTFILTHMDTKEARFVKQLQFTAWPDYGIPETPLELLSFMDEIRMSYETTDRSMEHPLILHCSAGVGRTGTFCCVYSAMLEITGGNGLVEVPVFIRKLRQCRAHMVQKKEQLVFCYQAILCYVQQFLATEQVKQQQSALSSQSCDGDDIFLPDVPHTMKDEVAMNGGVEKGSSDGPVQLNSSTAGKLDGHDQGEKVGGHPKYLRQNDLQQEKGQSCHDGIEELHLPNIPDTINDDGQIAVDIDKRSSDKSLAESTARTKEESSRQDVFQLETDSRHADTSPNSLTASELSLADSKTRTDPIDHKTDALLLPESKCDNNVNSIAGLGVSKSSSETVNNEVSSSINHNENAEDSDEGIADVVIKPREFDEGPSDKTPSS